MPFSTHSAVVQPSAIISPRLVTVGIQRPILRVLTKEEQNHILDQLIEREQRLANLHAQSELHSEGRIHRNTRPQRHE